MLAMALLKIALLAVSELAHLLTYTLLLVCGLCMWFGVWCFAAYGAASGTSDEVFVSTGRVFPLSRCTEYAYSQVRHLYSIPHASITQIEIGHTRQLCIVHSSHVSSVCVRSNSHRRPLHYG